MPSNAEHETVEYALGEGSQVSASGAVEINGVGIDARDGAAIKDVAVVRITAVAWRQVSKRGQNKPKRGKDARPSMFA